MSQPPMEKLPESGSALDAHEDRHGLANPERSGDSEVAAIPGAGGGAGESPVHRVVELQSAGEMPMREVHSVFSTRTKVFLVTMTVFSTLFSPLSAFIYLPTITPIAEAYGRSVAEINLSVTVYQVMQATAPLLLGDLSDQIGRRPVYALAFAVYLGANVGLALQDTYAALLVLRALQSTGCSATVAIGSAVMADVATSAERGGYITAVQASVMFAPALAPVLGGILTQFLGWRSTFWFLVVAAGVFLLVYLPFVPEVCVCVCVHLCLLVLPTLGPIQLTLTWWHDRQLAISSETDPSLRRHGILRFASGVVRSASSTPTWKPGPGRSGRGAGCPFPTSMLRCSSSSRRTSGSSCSSCPCLS